MTPVLPIRSYRLLLAVPAVGLTLALAACGGDDMAGSSHGSMSGTSSAAASSPSAATSASGHDMGSMATYPPVTPGPAAAGPRNDADVAFATGMIPHHGQAVQMADMILDKTANPEVKALAERIKQAQTPEIAALSGWLKGWGQTPPDPFAAMTGMTGMGHGGMMTEEQLGQLGNATGAAADKAFLTLMQEHHQGAIDMAKAETAHGANPAAKTLAQSISTSQAAEIAQMQKMLTAIG